jgi:AcrR family transcriptional regulator
MARPGRPVSTRSEVLVGAASRIIDRRGRAAFSLRALAREADVSTTAIYTHFASAEAVLDAVAEAYLEGTEYPRPSGDALADVKAFVMADFRRALEHPELAALVLERAPLTRAGARALEHLGSLLLAAGDEPATVTTALSTLGLHTLGAFTTLGPRRSREVLRRFEADVDLILDGVAVRRLGGPGLAADDRRRG